MATKKEQKLEKLISTLERSVKAAGDASEYGIQAELARVTGDVWKKLEGHRASRRRKK